MSHQFAEANREQTSFLAPLERRALRWLAARMPERIVPDHLTILGFGAMAAAAVFYWLAGKDPSWLHLVNLALVVNWFGDSLDGSLARYRQKLRPRYGFYVDHVTDAIGTVLLLLGLSASGFMRPAVGVGLLISYFLLTVNSYLATHVLGTFRLSFWKFSPTELRLLLIAGNLALLRNPQADVMDWWPLFDLGGCIAIVCMTATLLISVGITTYQLYQLEPPYPTVKAVVATRMSRG